MRDDGDGRAAGTIVGGREQPAAAGRMPSAGKNAPLTKPAPTRRASPPWLRSTLVDP
jgi:hypothetical protein